MMATTVLVHTFVIFEIKLNFDRFYYLTVKTFLKFFFEFEFFESKLWFGQITHTRLLHRTISEEFSIFWVY